MDGMSVTSYLEYVNLYQNIYKTNIAILLKLGKSILAEKIRQNI
jgi:hypothetical protein